MYFEFDDVRRFHQPYVDLFQRLSAWRPPPYNSPSQNWKRGLYAMSTGIFAVEPIRHFYANMNVMQ